MTFRSQLELISGHDLGYNSSYVLIQEFEIKNAFSDQELDQLKNNVEALSTPIGIAASRGSLVGDSPGSMWRLSYQDEMMSVAALKIDYDYLKVMQIPLIKGRGFERTNAADAEGSVIVNEAFLEFFNLDDDIIGHTPVIFGESGPKIIGVVSDYHFQSLRKEVEPLVLNLRPDSKNAELYARIDGQDIDRALKELDAVFAKSFPDRKADFVFLDSKIENQYYDEMKWEASIGYASGFAVFLVILGLLGMTSIFLAQRKKEQGIRKVLGAKLVDLYMLQARKFAWILLFSLIIILPAGLQASEWIKSMFFIQSQRTMYNLLVSVAVIALITLSIVAIQVYLSNRSNILKALREE